MFSPTPHAQIRSSIFCKGEQDGSGDPYHPDRDDQSATLSSEGGGRHVVCRACGHQIAKAEDKSSVAGGQSHTFFNPHGLVFELECYSRANGCMVQGAPSSDFSWFAGYSWQVALCGGCTSHLGWHYASADSGRFWGLISGMIREEDDLD